MLIDMNMNMNMFMFLKCGMSNGQVTLSIKQVFV